MVDHRKAEIHSRWILPVGAVIDEFYPHRIGRDYVGLSDGDPARQVTLSRYLHRTVGSRSGHIKILEMHIRAGNIRQVEIDGAGHHRIKGRAGRPELGGAGHFKLTIDARQIIVEFAVDQGGGTAAVLDV